MQLRRFQGGSASEALGAVRRALGDDAIILSNRQVGDRVEIIATGLLDEADLAAAAGVAVVADKAPGASASGGAAAMPPARAEEPVRAVFERLPAADGSADGPNGSHVVGSSVATESLIGDLSAELATLARSAPARGATAPPADGARAGAAAARATARPTDEAAAEIRSALSGTAPAATDPASAALVRVERRLRRLEANLWGELEPIKAAHVRQLLELGLGAELAVRLVERLAPGTTPKTAIRQSLSLLKSTLPIGVDRSGAEPGVTVLSGPVGAGKTTALVKLAAREVQRGGPDSLVLVSADMRRIGAFESLQVYGRLLGVPVVQARDAEELESLIEAFAHKSLVLVDHVPLERDDAMRLPRPSPGPEGERALRHLLVLPATLQPCALEAGIALHREAGVTHAVLTQLDRAARLGAVFSPLIRHNLPIAYWSDNARVQTPLEKADASVLVATAVATGRRVGQSVDERCLLELLQPTRHSVQASPLGARPTFDARGIAQDAADPR